MHDHQLLDDRERADGDQDLTERRAVNPTNDDPLEDKAERAAGDGGREQRHQQRREIERQRQFAVQPASGRSTRTAI